MLLDVVAVDSVLIQPHTQPWSLWQPYAALLIRGQWFLKEIRAESIWVLIPFEPTAIGDRGDKVQSGNCAHCRRKDVRNDRQALGLCQGRDLAALGNATRPDHIWLNDINRVARD